MSAQDTNPPLRGAPEQVLGVENFPGAWNMPNTDIYLKFGGYFKLDAIYDWTGAGTRNQFLIGQIPVDGSPEATAGPFFNMHLRETRFNFDLRTTTGAGRPLKFFLEFDFFDEGLKAGQPRLRHAFVYYGNLLVGQTWTNLSDLRIFPFIIDFAFGDALFGGRSIQVRWEQDISSKFSYGISAEMPGLEGISDPFNQGGEAMPTLPLLSARITNERDDGIIMVGIQAEQLRWDGRNTVPDATALGWGVILNGRQSITKKIFATWHASYSSGMTDQIIVFGGSDQGAVLDPNGELITEDAYNFALGGGYQFIDNLSFNLAYAFVNRGELKYRPDETVKKGGIGHANLIWDVGPNAKAGIEYMWGDRQNLDGAEGEASRVQAMVRYAF